MLLPVTGCVSDAHIYKYKCLVLLLTPKYDARIIQSR